MNRDVREDGGVSRVEQSSIYRARCCCTSPDVPIVVKGDAVVDVDDDRVQNRTKDVRKDDVESQSIPF